jgi:putative sporulation protein YtxC
MIKFVPASQKRWGRFIPYLTKELQTLENDQFKFEFISSEDGMVTIIGKQFPEHLSKSDIIDTYRHFFSTALAEYIVEDLEKSCIEQLIKQDFGYAEKKQMDAIYGYCYRLLFIDEELENRDELKVVERKCKVFRKAYEYLEEGKEFNLEGFLNFRLKEYKAELEEVIEYAVDEYILDKEYQEFIQLLKYFIKKQGSKMPFLHVYHLQDQQFLLFDKEGDLVTDEEVEKHLQRWSNHAVSKEDLIVSTLITINPNRFILHTNEPHITVIQTLRKIFSEQISICTGCKHCKRWKSKQIVESKT